MDFFCCGPPGLLLLVFLVTSQVIENNVRIALRNVVVRIHFRDGSP